MRTVDVVLLARLDGVDGPASTRLVERLRAATDTLVVEGSHSGSHLALTMRGDARTMLALLDGRLTDGEKILADTTPTVVSADVDHVSSEKAATVSNHLLNAAQNKPEDGGALDIRTEHDEARSHLTVRLTGSAFATSYLLFLVYLQMTQSRT
jgi:hypothetical protein